MSELFNPEDRQKHELASMSAIFKTPWETAVEPLQVAPHIYYAGNSWVGVFWLVTPDGLVLFDAGLPSQTYLIFDGMRQKGFSPKDIKLVLLSHAHYDHCGGLKAVLEYTGAKCYCSREDAPLLSGESDELLNGGLEYQAASPDCYYTPGETIELGGYSIEPVVIGGHTEGTTCFFLEDRDRNGKGYQVGIHGGLGLSRLVDAHFSDAREAIAAREKYRKAQEAVYHRGVDISLSYHPYNLNIVEKAQIGSWTALVDSDSWRGMLDTRLKALNDLETGSVFTQEMVRMYEENK